MIIPRLFTGCAAAMVLLTLVCSVYSQQKSDNENQLEKFELGGHLTFLGLRDFGSSAEVFRNFGFSQRAFIQDINEYGYGGRFTYNINRNLAVEGVVNYQPSNPSLNELNRRGRLLPRDNVQTGGSKTQVLGGLKYGIRRSRYGVFAKARAGSIRFGSYPTVTALFTDPPGASRPNDILVAVNEAPQVFFNSEVGGVLEFYPSKKTMIRVDAGDTIIRYNPKSSDLNPTFWRHNLQVSAGFGFRF